jgi:aryl-alcohol dehydrogenase-like predicted oxidoreductase
MEYRKLGQTGLMVSELCLGTMTFGNEADEQTSKKITDRFVEAGGNFVDTANVYSRGISEEITGRVIRDYREDVVLATKFRFPMGEGPNDSGASRKHIISACEASLRRLDTDYIDLVSDPLLGQLDPDRGDALGARRSGARGQGPLYRLLQLHRLAHREIRPRERA